MNETPSGRNNNTLGQTLKQVERAVLSGPRLVAYIVKAVWPCDPSDYNHESPWTYSLYRTLLGCGQDVFLRSTLRHEEKTASGTRLVAYTVKAVTLWPECLQLWITANVNLASTVTA